MKPKAKGGSTYTNKAKVKPKAKPKTKRDTRKSDTKELRCAPTFYVIRAFCIHFLAEQGMPTEEIAQRLDVNRSFVIKQSTLVMTPRTEQEKRIYDIAKTMSEAFRLANIDGLLFGRDLVTKLAGRSPSAAVKPVNTPARKKLKLSAPQEPLDTRE
jgi:hypothetical protein